MNDARLPKILLSILDRPVCDVSHSDLLLWLMICDTMERRHLPDDVRHDLKLWRAEVETEVNRRRAIKAIVQLASFETAPRGAAISSQPGADGISEKTSRFVTSWNRG
jgi:hypothetical protein